MRVLILGGGGTLGAFSAGALRALAQAGWESDAAIGSSAGSINLLRATVGGPDEAVRFWTSLRWPELLWGGVRAGMRRDGLLDVTAFRARVDEGVDYERLLVASHPVGFIVCDLESGKVSVRGNRTEKSAEDLRAVAHAAFAIPPLFGPVQMGSHFLADGGLLHNVPLDAAMKLGATEIVYLCNVQVLPHEGWEPTRTVSATTRYLEIFFRRASNVGFADAHITEGRYHGIPFLTIAPPRALPLDSLLKWTLPTPRSMQQLVRHGEMRARLALAAARDHGHRIAPERVEAPDFARTGVG
jgi:NTE family protein